VRALEGAAAASGEAAAVGVEEADELRAQLRRVRNLTAHLEGLVTSPLTSKSET